MEVQEALIMILEVVGVALMVGAVVWYVKSKD